MGNKNWWKKKTHEVYQKGDQTPNIYEAIPWALQKPTKKQNGQNQDEK
jgi:hypothetical protein